MILKTLIVHNSTNTELYLQQIASSCVVLTCLIWNDCAEVSYNWICPESGKITKHFIGKVSGKSIISYHIKILHRTVSTNIALECESHTDHSFLSSEISPANYKVCKDRCLGSGGDVFMGYKDHLNIREESSL